VESLTFYYISVTACFKMLTQNTLKHNHSDIFTVECLFESELHFSIVF